MTAADIQAIRDALAAGPTPGPWLTSGMVRAAYVEAKRQLHPMGTL